MHGIRELKNLKAMQAKIKAINMLTKMQKTIREENEALIALKGMCPDRRIPKGLLTAGSQAIKDALAAFDNAEDIDGVNEMLPSVTNEIVKSS